MWIVDVLVIGVVVLFTTRGFLKGFFGASNGLFGRFGGFLSSLFVSSLLSVFMKRMGVVKFLKDCYETLLREKLNVMFFAGKISEVLSMITVVFGCFLICKWTVKYFFKAIHSFFSAIRDASLLFRRVDGIIGAVIGVSVSCVIVLGAFGFIRFLENYGYVDGISAMIGECKMSSVLYENNPIAELFASNQIAEKVVKLIG